MAQWVLLLMHYASWLLALQRIVTHTHAKSLNDLSFPRLPRGRVCLAICLLMLVKLFTETYPKKRPSLYVCTTKRIQNLCV